MSSVSVEEEIRKFQEVLRVIEKQRKARKDESIGLIIEENVKEIIEKLQTLSQSQSQPEISHPPAILGIPS